MKAAAVAPLVKAAASVWDVSPEAKGCALQSCNNFLWQEWTLRLCRGRVCVWNHWDPKRRWSDWITAEICSFPLFQILWRGSEGAAIIDRHYHWGRRSFKILISFLWLKDKDPGKQQEAPQMLVGSCHLSVRGELWDLLKCFFFLQN